MCVCKGWEMWDTLSLTHIIMGKGREEKGREVPGRKGKFQEEKGRETEGKGNGN